MCSSLQREGVASALGGALRVLALYSGGGASSTCHGHTATASLTVAPELAGRPHLCHEPTTILENINQH